MPKDTPIEKKYTVVHQDSTGYTYEKALEVAKKLALTHPGTKYHVLATVAVVKTDDPPVTVTYL